uniref:Chromo shadow domain-containing protein n=1 Tax=Glossina pallidipes TaxID=7398 RepID=A0A1B0AIX4_GLOPL
MLTTSVLSNTAFANKNYRKLQLPLKSQLCWLRMANTRENLGIIDMLYAGYESEDQTDMSFIHELQPTEILRAVQEPSGRLLFLIKWRDPHGAHVLDAADAKILWPQLVIKFYESLIDWKRWEFKKNESIKDSQLYSIDVSLKHRMEFSLFISRRKLGRLLQTLITKEVLWRINESEFQEEIEIVDCDDEDFVGSDSLRFNGHVSISSNPCDFIFAAAASAAAAAAINVDVVAYDSDCDSDTNAYVHVLY